MPARRKISGIRIRTHPAYKKFLTKLKSAARRYKWHLQSECIRTRGGYCPLTVLYKVQPNEWDACVRKMKMPMAIGETIMVAADNGDYADVIIRRDLLRVVGLLNYKYEHPVH